MTLFSLRTNYNGITDIVIKGRKYWVIKNSFPD